MNSTAIAALLIAALAAGSYLAGDHNRNNAWLAKQAAQERDARAALDAEVMRSAAAQLTLLADQADMQDRYQSLEESFNALIRRGPILVARTGTDGNSAADQCIGHHTDLNSGQEKDVPIGGDAGGIVDADLSFGAVWMWNSALAATDIPAGSCGVADTSPEACAAGSGVSIEAAIGNHITNAKSCAEDRLKHQQLIDYLTALPTPKP